VRHSTPMPSLTTSLTSSPSARYNQVTHATRPTFTGARMTSEDPRRDQTAWQSETLPHPALQPEFDGRLRRAVGEVMDIEDITLPLDSAPLRFRGRLTLPSDQAFDRLRPAFEEVGY